MCEDLADRSRRSRGRSGSRSIVIRALLLKLKSSDVGTGKNKKKGL
jgi:hypothetical protein